LNSDLEIARESGQVVLQRRVQVIRPAHSSKDVLVDGLHSLVLSAGLLRAMTLTRLKMRYRYSLLGWGWALLQPLSLTAVYGLIFSHLTGDKPEPLPYTLFVFAGLTPWVFCSTAISTAVAGMLNHRTLMATVYFPREIVPISFVAASLIDLVIAVGLLFLMMLYYRIPISVTALFILPIFLILTVFVISICLLLSSIQVRIRDISIALPLILQVLVFGAPIVYPASAVPLAFRSLYWLNPFAILIQSFRDTVISGRRPLVSDLLYCTVMAITCFLISYLIFKRIEPTIVDDM
jgi:lipopolysaccharide transport system permease protein